MCERTTEQVRRCSRTATPSPSASTPICLSAQLSAFTLYIHLFVSVGRLLFQSLFFFFPCLLLWVFTSPSPKRQLSLLSKLSRPTWKWPSRFKRRLNKFQSFAGISSIKRAQNRRCLALLVGISDVGVSLLMHDAWRPTYSLLCYLWCLIYHCHMT